MDLAAAQDVSVGSRERAPGPLWLGPREKTKSCSSRQWAGARALRDRARRMVTRGGRGGAIRRSPRAARGGQRSTVAAGRHQLLPRTRGRGAGRAARARDVRPAHGGDARGPQQACGPTRRNIRGGGGQHADVHREPLALPGGRGADHLDFFQIRKTTKRDGPDRRGKAVVCGSMSAQRLPKLDLQEGVEVIVQDRTLSKGGVEMLGRMLRQLPQTTA